MGTTKVQIHLFRGIGRVFGCTEDASGSNLPAQFSPWAAFKTIGLEWGVSTAGIEADECLDHIEKYGFHLTEAHVRITERALQG